MTAAFPHLLTVIRTNRADYGLTSSPRHARITLAEKGVPHETVVVDLRLKAHVGGLPRDH